MKMNRNLSIALALVLVFLLYQAFWSGGSGNEVEGGFVKVGRGDLSLTLSERGTLTTRNATNIRSVVRGRRRIEWLVDEGTVVKKGDILVELEKTEVQRRIDQLENELISVETSLNSAIILILQHQQLQFLMVKISSEEFPLRMFDLFSL